MKTDKKSLSFSKVLRRTLVLSFILHFSMAIVQDDPPGQNEYSSVTPKTKQNRRIRVKYQKPKVSLKTYRKKQQIVESERSNINIDDEIKTNFLSDKTQITDRQTVAKTVGVFKEAGKGVETGNEKKTPSKKKKKIIFSDLSPGKFAADWSNDEASSVKGIEFARENTTGMARSNDFIDDIPLGDITRLNTLQFKYYGFYHRIKKKLEQYWGFEIRQKAKQLMKEGRKPVNTNAITSLAVVLDSKGNIIEITITSTSGVRELDEAAVQSFNRAGPFPNPPEGMLKNGMTRIEWGFVVKS
ncbi:MAG: TonB family protein [Halobacteriovoraceae bacterium]|nr:TonB family protein [Halobacteriovoraceae bacterium]